MPYEGRAFPSLEVTVAGAGAGPVGKATIALPTAPASTPKRLGGDPGRRGRRRSPTPPPTEAGGPAISFALPAVFVVRARTRSWCRTRSTAYDRAGQAGAVLPRGARRPPPDPTSAASRSAGPTRRPRAGPARFAPPPGSGSSSTGRPRPGTTTAADVRGPSCEEVRRPAFYPRVDRAWVVDEAGGHRSWAAPRSSRSSTPAPGSTHGNEEGNPGLAFHTSGHRDLARSPGHRPGTGPAGVQGHHVRSGAGRRRRPGPGAGLAARRRRPSTGIPARRSNGRRTCSATSC